MTIEDKKQELALNRINQDALKILSGMTTARIDNKF